MFNPDQRANPPRVEDTGKRDKPKEAARRGIEPQGDRHVAGASTPSPTGPGPTPVPAQLAADLTSVRALVRDVPLPLDTIDELHSRIRHMDPGGLTTDEEGGW